jgi:hypothetical protein
LRFWSDFGLHFGPPAFHHSPVLGHLPLSWVISRCLGSPPALRCDFFLSWVRFWTVFGPFPTKSGLDFLLRGPFFYDSGVVRSLFFCSFLSSFVLCCRVVVLLFVCLFVCLFVGLFLCLFVCLFSCLFSCSFGFLRSSLGRHKTGLADCAKRLNKKSMCHLTKIVISLVDATSVHKYRG